MSEKEPVSSEGLPSRTRLEAEQLGLTSLRMRFTKDDPEAVGELLALAQKYDVDVKTPGEQARLPYDVIDDINAAIQHQIDALA